MQDGSARAGQSRFIGGGLWLAGFVALALLSGQFHVERAVGVLLVLIGLLDVFLTVLHARISTGFISHAAARLTWYVFRAAAARAGRYGARILGFCGPVSIVLIVFVWASVLTLGAAMIIQPSLGTSVRANSGPTPAGFLAALYAGGSSMSFVGANDFAPRTGTFRLVYLFNSLVGMSVMSLTLTYLMQIYSALRQRNVLALKVHLFAGETGDAAELVAGLDPHGKFSNGYGILAEIAGQIAEIQEAHHFYPVLVYFRFCQPYYAVSRFTLVALDAATLIKCGLSNKEYGWLKETAIVTHLWRASILLLKTLEDAFVSTGTPPLREPPDGETRDLWRRRYFAALERLRQAGMKTTPEEEEGAELYVALRSQWYGHIAALAPFMDYGLNQVDPVGTDPATSEVRPDFSVRRHSLA